MHIFKDIITHWNMHRLISETFFIFRLIAKLVICKHSAGWPKSKRTSLKFWNTVKGKVSHGQRSSFLYDRSGCSFKFKQFDCTSAWDKSNSQFLPPRKRFEILAKLSRRCCQWSAPRGSDWYIFRAQVEVQHVATLMQHQQLELNASASQRKTFFNW